MSSRVYRHTNSIGCLLSHTNKVTKHGWISGEGKTIGIAFSKRRYKINDAWKKGNWDKRVYKEK